MCIRDRVTDASPYSQTYAWRTAPADGECVLRWQWTAGGTIRNFTIIVRGGTAPGDNPKLEYRHNGDSLWLRRSGVLLASQSRSFTTGTWYVTRVKWFGTTIQGRTWLDGTTEPTTWDTSVTDASAPASGNLILRVENGDDSVADTISVDYFTLIS